MIVRTSLATITGGFPYDKLPVKVYDFLVDIIAMKDIDTEHLELIIDPAPSYDWGALSIVVGKLSEYFIPTSIVSGDEVVPVLQYDRCPFCGCRHTTGDNYCPNCGSN